MEAFFLTIIFSVLTTAFSDIQTFRQHITAVISITAGLALYFIARQLITSTELDWLLVLLFIGGAGFSVLIRLAVVALCRRNLE
jgi:hypothetical protein